MRYLVLIGDIVASRNSARRHDLQEQMKAVFAELNQNNAGLISPYTLTLGDEFQVVFNQADRVFTDIFAILAILPVKVRFSLGLGAITTDLNPVQALGVTLQYQWRIGRVLFQRQCQRSSRVTL